MTIKIEAKYKVVTPLFCGGSDPASYAELRLPSFKGVLRFWWRALAWSRCDGNLECVRREEAELFGSAETGQSKMSMRLEVPNRPRMMKAGEVLRINGRVVGQGVRYLGYGVMEAFGKNAGKLTRSCLDSPIEFTVHMRLREREECLPTLKDALICLGVLGGMGAKSRKGYGSLALQSLRVNGERCWILPKANDELGGALKTVLVNRIDSGFPPYTALSTRSRHLLVTARTSDAMGLLDRLGRELVRYRSWGHKGKILGNEPSEQNFKQDHDLMKEPARDRHPERIAFGLPHNYGRSRDQQVEPAEGGLDRRASPLFIHIHECGSTPVGVVSFLPALFLPRNKSRIRVGSDIVPQQTEDKLYEPIHNFLDRLLENPKEPLQAKEVRL